MGSDDLYKKKKKLLDERKKEFRTPRPNSFLIVSEGTKTEPLYFDGLAKHIFAVHGKGIEVKKPIIDTKGEGKCTVSLVEAAVDLVRRAPIVYSQVWVLFDHDDFHDFDLAIRLAEQHEFKVAWSNQSFEYWLCLHFNYFDSALRRDEWARKLTDIFKSRGINKKGYQKNDPEIFNIVTSKGSLKSAVKYAQRIEATYDKSVPPSQRDPSTTVHHLILELAPYLSDLL